MFVHRTLADGWFTRMNVQLPVPADPGRSSLEETLNPYDSPLLTLSVESVAASHLLHGEYLIWCGRPRQGIVFRPIDIVLIPFSIFACAFFFVWSYFAVRHFPIPLKFLSFLAIGFGFYLAYGRFLLDARRRRNTIYAITNRRCLWINEREQSVEQALAHQGDREISLINMGSVGTIAFGRRNGLGYMYARAMGAGGVLNATAEFEMIEHAERLRDTVRSIALGIANGVQDGNDSIPSE
jgi:hypothetical protein